MPPLSSNNRFSILSVDSIPEIDESIEAKVVPIEGLAPEKPTVKLTRPKLERRLPRHFIISFLDETEEH